MINFNLNTRLFNLNYSFDQVLKYIIIHFLFKDTDNFVTHSKLNSFQIQGRDVTWKICIWK